MQLMEPSPRDSPLHSATCGVEGIENNTFRPKSAKGRCRHTPQQQASTTAPPGRFLDCPLDDQQEGHRSTVDCPATRTPVVRPKSAMGRRKPSQQTSGEQNQTLTTDHPGEVRPSTKPLYLFHDDDNDRQTIKDDGRDTRDSIGKTNRQTGKERVTSRQTCSPVFDQVNPDVRGQSMRPKSSKGRQRHPVQPQPCVQSEPSTPKSQNTEENLNIKKISRYQHVQNPEQTDRRVTSDSSLTPNHPQSCEVLPGSDLLQSPLRVPPVPTSSLNKYCVLPSIRRRNIKKHKDQ